VLTLNKLSHIMQIKTSENLIKLAKLFSAPLYITGGHVRNCILNLETSDIDICSVLKPEEVSALLQGSGFICKNMYPRMGTLKIVCGSGENYEYTAFREEEYNFGHTPKTVRFVSDIILDAKRRDFKMNAIYYDILSKRIADPLGGLKDLENKEISCVKDPDEVFKFDGLRLLRLVRFSAELNFKIEKETYLSARKNCEKLAEISEMRKTDEFLKIIYSPQKYQIDGNSYAHYYALKKLIDLNLIQFLIPQLLKGSGLEQRTDFHKYDVLEHSLQTFKYSDPKIRLSSLLHDIGKPYVFLKTGKYFNHDKEGVRIADEILTKQIKVPSKIKKDILREIEAHMFDIKGNEICLSVRLFFVKYYDVLENIFLLRQADYTGAGKHGGGCPVLQKWKKIYIEMKEQNIPFKISELKIKGGDLMDLGIEKVKISNLLNTVFYDCVLGKVKNKKADLLKYTEKTKNQF